MAAIHGPESIKRIPSAEEEVGFLVLAKLAHCVFLDHQGKK